MRIVVVVAVVVAAAVVVVVVKQKMVSGKFELVVEEEIILIVVTAHVLLVFDLNELGNFEVRDFGPAGPSFSLSQNYLTVVCWRGS